MSQKEALTPFGFFLLRVVPALLVLGVLCACLFIFVLPNMNGILTAIPAYPLPRRLRYQRLPAAELA